ncbi:Trk system potassium uptake protein TrkA [Dissulfuribacter thermophilus]|uniref:Trk system potassium uptake protein TrkA n=1 Tax=Dissulfuribacter thermophilus TaxID=1156395 RepID=A0A1B9F8I8_9BACT|nr:Trk system potassium transporter TrkA [Dissulfuribacter thermophilus]OCC16164.1 Trk system potassium uptake protein TrkA [Dissulfuribacter thermophilus]
MKILIIGAGAVGGHLCSQLSSEGHEVTLIDKDASRLRKIENELNIMTIEGNGASAEVLEEAGVKKADLFIAVTNIDEVNLIACILAKEYGVVRKVARVRNEEYLSTSSPLNQSNLGLDLLINPDHAMAEEILRICSHLEAFEAVELARGDVTLIGYEIKDKSPLCGITLMDLRELKGLYDFVIPAIVRHDETIVPRGEDEIKPGDKIYFIVKKQDIPKIEELIGVKSRAPNKVFVIGGGQVGIRVARNLEKQDVQVYLVDEDPIRCEFLAEKLDKTIVLNVDGLDSHELITEGIDTCDLVIAVTDEDTTNILASLLAKHLGAKKCITRISRPDFIPLLGKLGIDVPLSSRLVAANMILRFVRRGTILSAATLLGSNAEVLEFIVSKMWPYLGLPLKDIPFPKGANVGAIVREGHAEIPTGASVIRPDDKLIIFTLKNVAPKLERLFAG